MRRALLILPLLYACNDKATDDSTPVTGVAWYPDIEPIMAEKCATCHQAGGLGPGDWTDYAAAAANAAAINTYIAANAMPLPAADPECRPYHGHERMHLTDQERADIDAWVQAGAPEGEPGLSTHPEVPVLRLNDTDLTLPMPAAYTLQPDPDGNDYWCMVLDNPFTEPRYITGFDVDVGNRAVVHHMLLAVDSGHNAGIEYGTDGHQQTFQCRDPVVESDWMLLHAWTPGMEPVEMPDGVGLLVQPGDQIVLQMHYFSDPDGPAQTDLSSYRLRTTDSVPTEAFMTAVGPTDILIPANATAHTEHQATRNNFGGPLTIYGAFPHMHLLGTGYEAKVTRSDGSEDCLVRGEYDFDHQMTYMFEEPMVVQEGERLGMQCTWDNSADNPRQYNDPPRPVRFGEGSNQEMCFLLFYYSM